MSSSALEAIDMDGDSMYSYECGPVEEFTGLDHIVQFLFNTGLINNIECRKIVSPRPPMNLVKIRAAIYEIMLYKDSKTFKEIARVLRNRVHPLQNPRILLRIFSYLKYADISKCWCVSPDWKQIVGLQLGAKYDEVNLEQLLWMNLLSQNEKLQNTKNRCSSKDEKKASFFLTMLAINPEKDQAVWETLHIGRYVHPDVNNNAINVSCTAENKIDNIIASALNNHIVLSNIFQSLSLANIKNCRTVCRYWTLVSDPFLKKITTIKFYSDFGPLNFLNVSKYFIRPGLQFKSFKFRQSFSTEEMSEFFKKNGKNIQSLNLCLINGVRSCLSHTSNLTEIYMQGSMLNRFEYNPKTDVISMIPWSALQSIKILYLRDANIDADGNNERKRITPVKVLLKHVLFFVGGRNLAQITLNDYIDFSKVKLVNVNNWATGQSQQFDWGRDKFDAKGVSFSGIGFINAEKSQSSVRYLRLHLNQPFSENNVMSIKQLLIERGYISLAALPSSLEKLAICLKESMIVSSNVSIYLPNLKYLSYRKRNEFHLLSHFDNCTNLTDLEIWVINEIDIRWLPRNIKRLKVLSSCYGDLQFVDGLADEHFDLDLLILGFLSANRLNDLIFDKVRPKVLALELPNDLEDEAFVSFIRRNKNMDKIYVRHPSSVKPNVFSESQLSDIVDRQSEYYEFNNERGKAITSKEFHTIQTSLDLHVAMKGFLSTIYDQKAHAQSEQFFEVFHNSEYY